MTCALVGLFLLTGLVAAGAILRLHMINASVDRLISQDFQPLFEAENLVQRVQILVALTPKLLNVRDEFELGNLSSQIVDMFNVLDRSHARIQGNGVSAGYGREIDRHRALLRAALDQLASLVRGQLRLNAAMSGARHALNLLVNPADTHRSGNVRLQTLAALLYRASLADDAPEIDRDRLAAQALLKVPQGAPTDEVDGGEIGALVEGASSIFTIRQSQLDLSRTLQGEAGDTNLRANQLVYAVANLSAAMRKVAETARARRHTEVARTTAQLSLLFVITALIECGLLGYVRLGVLRRLVALRDSVSRQSGAGTEPLADDGADEIGDLARSLRFYVGEIKEKSDALQYLAATDPLTGLPNRREFMARGEADAARRRRYGHTSCVLMMDIDHFKKVNDSWGHPAGDRVICAVAGAGRAMFREIDVMGRVGGEEFAVLLAETGEGGALVAAERLRKAVEGMSVEIEGGRILTVTVSVGLARMEGGEEDFDQGMARADGALYEAKRGGRNRVCVAGQRSALPDEASGGLVARHESAS